MRKLPTWPIPFAPLDEWDESKFEHRVDEGTRYVGDGRSVVVRGYAIGIEGHRFDDTQVHNYCKIIQEYMDTVGGTPEQVYSTEKIFTDSDFRPYRSRVAYKFISHDVYEKYISRGRFLVSSLQRFRDLEEQENAAGDRFEGLSHSFYDVGNRQFVGSIVSGFDHHIFSLARDLKSRGDLEAKFGPVVLEFDLVPFAQALGKILRGTADVRLVRYADLKMHRGAMSLADVAGFPPQFTDRLARALRSRGRLPSIFAKPARFESEREVRITIGANADVPYNTEIDAPALLRFVRKISD